IDLSDVTSGSDPSDERWLMGEQLPVIGAIRSMSDPPSFGDPDRMTSALYFGGVADGHGVHTNSGVNNKAAFLLTDGGTFNGQTVTGLGIIKTAHIYYQAETTLLGPGSDYLDLYHALPQACTNLIGTAGISAGDCSQVTKAVTATEMNQFPITVGAHLDAPLCDGSAVQSSVLFSDDMEVNNGNFTTSATTEAALWGYFAGSSQSGSRSVHAADLGSTATSALTGQFSIAVPSGTTFLRFDHSFEMEYDNSLAIYYDGGVVEFSTNGGTNWQDAVAALPTLNGYVGTWFGSSGNPLAGRPAFSGPSPGYQTTRINLSALAGSNVMFRFRLGTDNGNFFAADGWFIDDVSIYTCALPAPPPPPPPPPPPLVSLVPGRLLDSRPGQNTVDGAFNNIGMRPAGTITAVTVTTRGGVSADATAVVLNVTVTEPQAAGFLTVYPCSPPANTPPNASNLNYTAGTTVANAVISKVGADGQVCIFNQSPTHLLIDVNGYFP
ncbi:MAG TPA: M4 family metallopeptidase, partial [Ilumatobacteraceae bacterium]|nr:M4 family metallopeptidase [Ilumatobacteraceae bacterium]